MQGTVAGGPLGPADSQQMPRTVSRFSATEIGQGRTVSDRAHYKDHFKQEAAVVSQYLQGVHHSRKLDWMQVGYDETSVKLSKMQHAVPVVLKKPDVIAPQMTSKDSAAKLITLRAHEEQMNRTISLESHNNQLKRYHNREVGRRAVVDEVMAGKGPPSKFGLGYDIFPQKCTHTQILAMTHCLAMPSAEIIPAPPAPRRKWLGEGVGWGPIG